jgi:hypothetical protein
LAQGDIPPASGCGGLLCDAALLIEYENRGNVEAVFSDFMLMLPRLEGVIDPERGFVLDPGAEVFIDKRPTTTFAGAQEYKALDYRTHRVRLAPGDSHTDFFDLGAFLPGAEQSDRLKVPNVPSDFSPVLAFHDSYGNNFYADTEGLHSGVYQYPHEAEMMKGRRRRQSIGILTRRRWLRWLGWTQKDTVGLGEPPPG